MKDTKKIVYDKLRNVSALIDVIGVSTAKPNIFPVNEATNDQMRIRPELIKSGQTDAFLVMAVETAGSGIRIIQPRFVKPDEIFIISAFGRKASFADTAIEIVDDTLDGFRIVGSEWGIKYMQRVSAIVDGGPYISAIAQRSASFLASGIYRIA